MSGAGVRWSRSIPGTAHSSPIVWGQQLFVTTAIGSNLVSLELGDEGGISLADDEALEWKILSLNKATGDILWERTPFRGQPRARRHVKASQANQTPVTDGRYVVAILGSEGMAAFTMSGEQLWTCDLGILDPGYYTRPDSQWGHASSPVIYRDRVIVQVDRHADSYLAAFRLSDGEPLWRVERDELPVWSSPLVAEIGGRTELVVNGGNYVRSYDPETGRELWRFHDFAEVKTPSPFAVDSRIVVTGGYPGGRPIFALRPGLEGDVSLAEGERTNEALDWHTTRYSGYTPTPLLYRGRLFSVHDNGVLRVLDGDSGELEQQMRLNARFSASPVAAAGSVYFCSEDGEMVVVDAASLEITGRKELDAPCMATPAISDGTLFVRSQRTLYAVGSGASSR